MSTKLTTMWTAINSTINRWMNGSLFFRGFTAVLDFFKRLCGSSFIARAFVADSDPLDDSIKRSYFAAFVHAMFNRLPKPVTAPAHWNGTLSKLVSGSWLIGGTCDAFGIPIPQPAEIKQSLFGIKAILQWLLFIFPVVGMMAVLFAVPFLPTMLLAAMLVPILFLILLSRSFVIDSTTVFLLIFIILSMIAAVASLAPRSSIQIALLTSIFMLSVPAVVACCTTRKSAELLIIIFVVSAGITGLYGVFQALTGATLDIWQDQELFADTAGRVSSTFGNPNVYGTYLLLAIPIAAACIVYLKGFFFKFCAVGATGLLLISLMLTLSRGCFLSLALAVGIFVLIMEKRLVILFVPAVLALPFVLPQTILNRVLSIFNMADTSTAFRLNIWQGSLRILQDFWLSGVGQGIDAYNAVYPFYALAAIHAPHSHSLYIQYLVEVGVVGFAVFIIVLACFFRTMVNFLRHTTDFKQRVMAAAMIAAVIGFLFQGVTDFVFYNYRVLLTFYLFIGISIAFTRVNKPVITAEKIKSELVSNYHD